MKLYVKYIVLMLMIFLVMIKDKKANIPCFALWVGNTELLQKD